MRCGSIGSCHFGDCKALLVTSLTHTSGAVASVQTFTITDGRAFVYRERSHEAFTLVLHEHTKSAKFKLATVIVLGTTYLANVNELVAAVWSVSGRVSDV